MSVWAAKGVGLDKPETVSLSDDGTKAIVSNALGRSISVFELSEHHRFNKVLSKYLELDHATLLNYAHGAVFALNDNLALCVGEHANALSAFDVSGRSVGKAHAKPLWEIRGTHVGLDNPADLAIHKDSNQLVVANRRSGGFSFFELPQDLRSEPVRPQWALPTNKLNERGISAPHGVVVSADGRFLFATHKPFYLNNEDTGESAVTVFDFQALLNAREMVDPLAVIKRGRHLLHHIAYHDDTHCVAVTDSQGPVTLYHWDAELFSLLPIGSIDVFRIGEGVKGVCFTADGTHLFITSELDEILSFRVQDHTSNYSV